MTNERREELQRFIELELVAIAEALGVYQADMNYDDLVSAILKAEAEEQSESEREAHPWGK